VRIETVQAAVAAAMAFNLVAWAAPPAIGTVIANGAFRLDNAAVTGNATLFEGSSVETASAVSRLELATGARLSLAASSKGKIFGDHMLLEKGIGQLDRAENFRVEARGLSIQPETEKSSARVALSGGTRVQVAALVGSFRVLNSRGVLIADIAAGRAIEFEPQAASTPSKLMGCLVMHGVHYLLTDETTNVVVELGGPGLDKEKGNRVEITGAMDPTATPVSDASQFIRVSAVKRISKGCGSAGAAAAAGAGGAAGKAAGGAAGGAAGAGGGAISATTVAIIGGVAAAAAVGGLAAAGKLPGQGGSGTISRE